jgi:hypothetical protein
MQRLDRCNSSVQPPLDPELGESATNLQSSFTKPQREGSPARRLYAQPATWRNQPCSNLCRQGLPPRSLILATCTKKLGKPAENISPIWSGPTGQLGQVRAAGHQMPCRRQRGTLDSDTITITWLINGHISVVVDRAVTPLARRFLLLYDQMDRSMHGAQSQLLALRRPLVVFHTL